MLSKTFLVIVILAMAASDVLAKPSGVLLDDVMNNTICKTEVYYNVDDSRIPRVIKELKCAQDPYDMCPVSTGGEAPCCGGIPFVNGPRFTCTQVRDRVLVSHNTQGTYSMYVNIGCSCTKQGTKKAYE